MQLIINSNLVDRKKKLLANRMAIQLSQIYSCSSGVTHTLVDLLVLFTAELDGGSSSLTQIAAVRTHEWPVFCELYHP